MSFFTTVPAGSRVAIFAKDGTCTTQDGPARVSSFNRDVTPLKLFSAAAGQYLVIKFKDGRATHLPGPASAFLHPLEHASISVEQALPLDANHALVIYTQHPDNSVTRRILRGPSLYVPAPNEWLHTFSWHASDPNDPSRKVPHALQFTKLRVIPDQTYLTVDDVRTADDALLRVQLMIFFELMDVDVMLDQTHDPVADFVNAATADVNDFTAPLTFEQFKLHTDALNTLATYKQLAGRAGRIGYRINKVAYRGYHASPKLQAMHDTAIETRTRLRLESETETQAQALADLKLEREAARAAQRQRMEADELSHKLRLQQLQHDQETKRKSAEQQLRLQQEESMGAQSLRLRDLAHGQKLRHAQLACEQSLSARRARNDVALALRQARADQRVAFLAALHGLQVDLTRYLIAPYHPPDRLIRLDHADGAPSPQLHLHTR